MEPADGLELDAVLALEGGDALVGGVARVLRLLLRLPLRGRDRVRLGLLPRGEPRLE